MAFDAKKVKDDIIKWIRDWFEVNGKGCNAIVAISGGKDSSVVAALCVEARMAFFSYRTLTCPRRVVTMRIKLRFSST